MSLICQTYSTLHTGTVLICSLLACFFFTPELKELVDLHKEDADGNEDPLINDEVLIIQVIIVEKVIRLC